LCITPWLRGERPVRKLAKLGRVQLELVNAWSKRIASSANASRCGVAPLA
jgi:hypothetical protein